MGNDISKALKQKTDAMLRLQGQTQKPVVIENSDGSYYAPEQADYTASLVAGANIKITTSGNIKTIEAIVPEAIGNLDGGKPNTVFGGALIVNGGGIIGS